MAAVAKDDPQIAPKPAHAPTAAIASSDAGDAAINPLGGVIAGWTEGLQLMVVGEKRRFWIPQDLAYKGRPGAPAGMLVFDVELLSIAK